MTTHGTPTLADVANDVTANAPCRRSSRSSAVDSKRRKGEFAGTDSDNVRLNKNEPQNARESATTHSTVTKKISPKRKRVNQDGVVEKKITTTTLANKTHDDPEVSDDPDDDDHDEEVRPPPKRRRTKDVASSDDSCDCPHCHKKFGSSLGLQYHIEKFVCQPSLRPGGAVVRKGRRKITSVTPNDADDDGDDENGPPSAKTYKKIRGKIGDRTCPQCRRVFTSVTGMQYHRDKRVCEQGDSSNTPIPFHTLTPGLSFVTQYGIVEVVADDRATPYYVSESSDQQHDVTTDLRKQMKLYHNAVAKRQTRDQKKLLNVAIMSLARRMLLRQAYGDNASATGNGSSSTENSASFVSAVRHAYLVCSGVPQPTSNVPTRKETEDPSAPASLFPDRIVECKLLPDRRPRYIGDGDNFSRLDGLAHVYTNSNKIFMQRRWLTTPYNLDSERYYCPACYQCFTSKPGYRYHVDSKSCIKKAQSKADAMQQQLATIESRALQIVDKFRTMVVTPSDDVLSTNHIVSNQQTENESLSHSIDPSQIHEIPEPIPDVAIVDTATLVHPDTTLAQLESELYRVLGQMIGPMYPEVWNVLGYRKASRKVRKLAKNATGSDDVARAPVPSKNNRGSAFEEKEMVVSTVTAQSDVVGLSSVPKPITSIPLIIDIRPLAQEIDAGRYPSIKRYVAESSDGRDTVCSICKQVDLPPLDKSEGNDNDAENVLACDFCRQVEHYTCAITKYTIKYPEPCDDFMCHNCIGVVCTRRSRAERRRLEKLIAVNADSATLESIVLQQPSINQAKQEEIVSLTNGIVPHREFECVAAQGRRLDELYILLRDAQTRLSLALDVEDINQNRLSSIDTLYSDYGA